MRFVAAALFWLVTTIALGVAVPAMWAQTEIVDAGGFASVAKSAAHDPQLQRAIASELTTQIVSIAKEQGYELDSGRTRAVASAYTASPAFPPAFVEAARFAHQWLFTGMGQPVADGWAIDLAPLLKGMSIERILVGLNVDVPPNVPVIIDEDLRPGLLRPWATWGRWAGIGATVIAGVSALLTLAFARQRAKALAALGVSALVVGAGGWAGIEVARNRVDYALRDTTRDIRSIADVFVAHAENSAHHWFNITLAVGGALVVLGVILTVFGSFLRRRRGT